MVSKRSSKRKMGRPAGDPLDVRTERFSFRLHPHLYEIIMELAREAGLNHSIWIEQACVEKVHRDLKPGILDAKGRRIDTMKPGILDEIRGKPKR